MKKSSLTQLPPVLALLLVMITTIFLRTITLQLQGGVSSATSTAVSRHKAHGFNDNFKATCDDNVSKEHSLFLVCFCFVIIFFLLLLFIASSFFQLGKMICLLNLVMIYVSLTLRPLFLGAIS